MSSAATEEAPKVTAIGHPIKIKMTKRTKQHCQHYGSTPSGRVRFITE